MFLKCYIPVIYFHLSYLQFDSVGKHAKSTRLLPVSVEQMKDELETEVSL